MTKILIAEDSKTARVALQKELEGAGHEVMAVENGFRGILYIKKDNFDLILTDFNMPGTASDMISFMHNNNLHVPTIIVTSLTEKEVYDKGVDKEDLIGVLTKPYSKEDLLSMIDKGLNK